MAVQILATKLHIPRPGPASSIVSRANRSMNLPRIWLRADILFVRITRDLKIPSGVKIKRPSSVTTCKSSLPPSRSAWASTNLMCALSFTLICRKASKVIIRKSHARDAMACPRTVFCSTVIPTLPKSIISLTKKKARKNASLFNIWTPSSVLRKTRRPADASHCSTTSANQSPPTTAPTATTAPPPQPR